MGWGACPCDPGQHPVCSRVGESLPNFVSILYIPLSPAATRLGWSVGNPEPIGDREGKEEIFSETLLMVGCLDANS